jgi:hypothetical protein
MRFHNAVTPLLQSWEGCKAFPHLIFSWHIKRFVGWYLEVYTGHCGSSAEFLSKIPHLPDHLACSAVLNDLMKFQSLNPQRKKEFVTWFDEIFASDIAASCKKVVELEGIKGVCAGEVSQVSREETAKKLNPMAERWRKVMADQVPSENGKAGLGQTREKEKTSRKDEMFAIMGKPIEDEAKMHGWIKMFPDELLGK